MPTQNPNLTLQTNLEAVPAPSAQKVLLIGSITVNGTAPTGVVVAIPNLTAAATLLGGDSNLYQMAKAAIVTGYGGCYALPLADTGTAAAASITFSGTSTTAGTLNLYIGDANAPIVVPVATNTGAAALATAVAAAINAQVNVPFTATATTNAVDIELTNGGTFGNSTYFAANLSGASGITFTAGAFAGGATDPTVTSTTLAAVSDQYTGIVLQEGIAPAATIAWANARFQTQTRLTAGVVFQPVTGSTSALQSAATEANSPVYTIFGYQLGTFAADTPTAAYAGTYARLYNSAQVAQFAAIRALRLTPTTPISTFMLNPNFAYGGAGLATAPYFNTRLPQSPVPIAGSDWTLDQCTTLASARVAVIAANTSYTECIVGATPTTQTFNAQSVPTATPIWLNDVDATIVWDNQTYEMYQAEYGQSKLTNGSNVNGGTTAEQVKGSVIALYMIDGAADVGLTDSSPDNLTSFLQSLSVTTNTTTGQVQINCTPIFVGQVRYISQTTTVKV